MLWLEAAFAKRGTNKNQKTSDFHPSIFKPFSKQKKNDLRNSLPSVIERFTYIVCLYSTAGGQATRWRHPVKPQEEPTCFSKLSFEATWGCFLNNLKKAILSMLSKVTLLWLKNCFANLTCTCRGLHHYVPLPPLPELQPFRCSNTYR